MKKKKIKIYEWIRGSIIKEISIDTIQEELLKAVKNGEVQVLNSSFSSDYLFSEELIQAAINFDRETLEEARVLGLVIYYEFESGDYEEEYYPEFIRHFIKNNAYELSETNLSSLDIDDWEIIDIEVE